MKVEEGVVGGGVGTGGDEKVWWGLADPIERETLPRKWLQDVFDVAVESDLVASGFCDDEQVESLRAVAIVLGVDPMVATPENFKCKYTGEHAWVDSWNSLLGKPRQGYHRCRRCRAEERVLDGS